MFERFEEKARRVIFFARYEASQLGEHYIGNNHFLLALMREDKALFAFLAPKTNVYILADSLRANVTGEKISTSVDLPLSMDTKRVLALAAEESEQQGAPLVTTSHLLLGLLRHPGAIRDVLAEMGLEVTAVREALKDRTSRPLPPGNRQIMAMLRNEFEPLMQRLKPDVEPAVAYRLRAEKVQ
jgi:ATP-dependent Clp protease ATP-binding subunit ClpC